MSKDLGLYAAIILMLISTITCKQWSRVSNTETSTPKTDTKEWSSYDLENTDVRVDLPGKPRDQSPILPPAFRGVFSGMHIHSLDEKDFSTAVAELIPTGKKTWKIKDLADTSMASLKKQLPDLTYTLDISSETKAKYNGAFTRNGKPYDLRGCCVYKTVKPARVWAVFTLYPSDNVDLQSAGQRVIDSVVFKDSTEQCK